MRVVFMGSPDFAVPALRALLRHHEVVLVVTQPDKPAGRGKKLAPPPVKRIAEEAGLEILQPRSARKPELVEALRAARPDVCVVVAYGKILPAPVLEVARQVKPARASASAAASAVAARASGRRKTLPIEVRRARGW